MTSLIFFSRILSFVFRFQIIFFLILSYFSWQKIYFSRFQITFVLSLRTKSWKWSSENLRSSHSQMFFKVRDLKNFAIFTRKHFYWSLLSIETLKRNSKQLFCCEYCKYFNCGDCFLNINLKKKSFRNVPRGLPRSTPKKSRSKIFFQGYWQGKSTVKSNSSAFKMYENRHLGCWYIKSTLYKRFLNWNKIFNKINYWQNFVLWDRSILYSLLYLS